MGNTVTKNHMGCAFVYNLFPVDFSVRRITILELKGECMQRGKNDENGKVIISTL